MISEKENFPTKILTRGKSNNGPEAPRHLSPKQKKQLRDQQRHHRQQLAQHDLQDKLYNLAYTGVTSTHQMSREDKKSVAHLRAICDEDYNYFCFLTDSEDMQDLFFLFCNYVIAGESNKNQLQDIFMSWLFQLFIKYYIENSSDEIEIMLANQAPRVKDHYQQLMSPFDHDI
ncbi:MAG: hypothetical protein A3F10_07000 [Coxiella sp. RIFCSPHIGHO2_12_FULL_42_15]|nr:MAG: hypothetical protein A3F10_07000 [Coxiella sp. RIFCSPHIGHO2_12_FULL_42_15]